MPEEEVLLRISMSTHYLMHSTVRSCIRKLGMYL